MIVRPVLFASLAISADVVLSKIQFYDDTCISMTVFEKYIVGSSAFGTIAGLTSAEVDVHPRRINRGGVSFLQMEEWKVSGTFILEIESLN